MLPDSSVPPAGCSRIPCNDQYASRGAAVFESCGEALDATTVLAASRNASMTQRAGPRVWRSSGLLLCRTTARTFATPGRYVAAGLGPSKDSSQLQDKDLPELERKVLASERQPPSVGLVDRYIPSVSESLVPVIGGTLQNIAEFKRVLLKVPF